MKWTIYSHTSFYVVCSDKEMPCPSRFWECNIIYVSKLDVWPLSTLLGLFLTSPSRLPPSVCTLSLWFLGRMEKGVNLTVTFTLNEFVFIKLFDEHPSSTTGPVHIPQPLTKTRCNCYWLLFLYRFPRLSMLFFFFLKQMC